MQHVNPQHWRKTVEEVHEGITKESRLARRRLASMGSSEADEPKPELVNGEDKSKTIDLDKGVQMS